MLTYCGGRDMAAVEQLIDVDAFEEFLAPGEPPSPL